MRAVILMMLVVFSLSGCTGTEEYHHARNLCREKGYNKYPEKLREYKCTLYKSIEVPTGEHECITEILEDGTKTRTVCRDLTRTEQEPYESTCTEDLNDDKRSDFVDKCTYDSCMKDYGNEACNPSR